MSATHSAPPESTPRGAGLGKHAAGVWVAGAYVTALLVAVVVAVLLSREPLLWRAWWADCAGTLVIFAFSRTFRNSSFYDAYWSIAPMALAGWFAWLGLEQGAHPVRQVLVLGLVWWWGARLTFNWWRGWTGLGHEDWRYTDLRKRSGALYPVVDLLGIHVAPTAQVFLGCLALYPALVYSAAPLGPLDALGVAMAAVAIVIESRADSELHRFLSRRREPGEILSSGLWAYSRHPNYFGEMGFWVGLATLGYAADLTFVYSGFGALTIVGLFVFISVPMIERRSLERRPGYADHARRVSAIVPWFPRQ